MTSSNPWTEQQQQQQGTNNASLTNISSSLSSAYGDTNNNRDVGDDGVVYGNNNNDNDTIVFMINNDDEIGHNNDNNITSKIISNPNDVNDNVDNWNNLNRSIGNNIDGLTASLLSSSFEQKKNSHQMQIYNNNPQNRDTTKTKQSIDPVTKQQGMNRNQYQKPWYQCKNVTIEIPLDYNNTIKTMKMTSIQMNVSSGSYPIIQWEDNTTKKPIAEKNHEKIVSSSQRRRRHIIYGTMSGSCISLLGKTGYMKGNIQFQYTIPPPTNSQQQQQQKYQHRISFISGLRNIGIQNNNNHESINIQVIGHQQQTLFMIPKSLLLWIINQHNNNNIYLTTTIVTSSSSSMKGVKMIPNDRSTNIMTSTTSNNKHNKIQQNKPNVICISSCTIQNLNKGMMISTKIFHIKQYIVSYLLNSNNDNKRKNEELISLYPNISIFINYQLFSSNDSNNKKTLTTRSSYYQDSNIWMILNPYYHFIISFYSVIPSPSPSSIVTINSNSRTETIENVTNSNNIQTIEDDIQSDTNLRENNNSMVLSSKISSNKQEMISMARDLMNRLSRIWKWNIQIDWTNNKMNRNNNNNTSILYNLFMPSWKLHMSTMNPPLITKKQSKYNDKNNQLLLPIPIIPSTLKYDITWTWYGIKNGWDCSLFWTRHIYYINSNTISLMNRSLTSISNINNNSNDDNDETDYNNNNNNKNNDQLNKPPPLRPNRIFGMGIIWNATVDNNNSTKGTTSLTDMMSTLSSSPSLWSGMLLCNYLLHKLTWIISWTQSDLTLRIPIRLINIVQPSNHIINATICTISLNIISRFIQEIVHQIFVSSLQQPSSIDQSNQNNNTSNTQYPMNIKQGISLDHDMNMMYNHTKQLHQVAVKQQSFMMKQSINRMKKEKDINGLIIKKATYSIMDGDTFDVTIPLQFWTIENSQLILYKPFYHMIGFYNIIPSRKWNKYQEVKQRRQEQERLQQQQEEQQQQQHEQQQRLFIQSSLLWDRTKSFLYYFVTGRDYNDDYMENDNDYDDDNDEKVYPKLSIWYDFNGHSYYYEVYDKPDYDASSSSNVDDDMINNDSNRIIIPNPNASPSSMSMLFM